MKKMIGNKCYLSPTSLNDAEQLATWMADMEIAIFTTRAAHVITIQQEEEFLRSIAASKHDYVMGVHDLESDKLLGVCGLHRTNFIDRNAEMGIFIGDKDYRGKGYGMEAIRLILDYGFNILNLNSIFLQVLEYNERAYQLYKKCGFKEAGCLRQAKLVAGKKYHVIYMDMLAEEFSSVYIKNVLES